MQLIVAFLCALGLKALCRIKMAIRPGFNSSKRRRKIQFHLIREKAKDQGNCEFYGKVWKDLKYQGLVRKLKLMATAVCRKYT